MPIPDKSPLAPIAPDGRQTVQKLATLGAALLLTIVCIAYLHTWRADLGNLHHLRIYQYILAVFEEPAAWLTLAILVAALAFMRNKAAEHVASYFGLHPGTVAIATVVLLSLGSVYIHHDFAFSTDEYAMRLQAQIFASGHIFGHIDPDLLNSAIQPQFQNYFITVGQQSGKIVSTYWPGFSALLAPFEFVGIPWMCNPVISAVTLLLTHQIALRITNDVKCAGWAMLFALASTAFTADGISYYSMSAHLCANLAFVWLLLDLTPRRAFLAGVIGSIALLLHNPFPHFLFALPWLIWLAERQQYRKQLFCLILGYLPLGITIGVGWLQVKASLTAENSTLYMVDYTALVAYFRPPDGNGLILQLRSIIKVWLWSSPGLIVLGIIGYRAKHHVFPVSLLGQSLVLTFLGYFFFIFDQGHGWGYRYIHSAIGVLPVLAACALGDTGKASETQYLKGFFGTAALLSLLLATTLRATQIDTLIGDQIAQIPSTKNLPAAVVFIDINHGYYTGDLLHNGPFMNTREIRLTSEGSEKNKGTVARHWPGAKMVLSGEWGEVWSVPATSPSKND